VILDSVNFVPWMKRSKGIESWIQLHNDSNGHKDVRTQYICWNRIIKQPNISALICLSTKFDGVDFAD
jgi:hypothetical protein